MRSARGPPAPTTLPCNAPVSAEIHSDGTTQCPVVSPTYLPRAIRIPSAHSIGVSVPGGIARNDTPGNSFLTIEAVWSLDESTTMVSVASPEEARSRARRQSTMERADSSEPTTTETSGCSWSFLLNRSFEDRAAPHQLQHRSCVSRFEQTLAGDFVGRARKK